MSAERIRLKHRQLATQIRRSRLSQNHWAIKLGLDRGHFSQLLRGKRPYPNAATRRKLLDGLGADFEDLFEIEAHAARRRGGRPLFRDPGVRWPLIERTEGTMETLMQDIRYAIRRLRRSPGFTLLAALPLAIGLGANATIFSFVNAVLLRPLPVEQPEDLRRVALTKSDDVRTARVSYPDYLDYREHGEAFSDLTALTLVPVTLATESSAAGTGSADQVMAEVVSGNFFPALGLSTQLGRPLSITDDAPDSEPVAVIGDAFWRKRFGADPEIVGRKVILSGEPFTIVGVAKPEFIGTFVALAIDVWTPIHPSGRWFGGNWRHNRDAEQFQLIGRLRPGFEDEAAETALERVAHSLAQQFPEATSVRDVELGPATLVAGSVRRVVAGFFAVAMIMVGLILLLASANIAHLLLARAIDRRQETAVRLALGAGRFRVGRQFLTESIALALLGGAAGWLFALWSARLLSTWNPVGFVPLRIDLAPDLGVLLFTLALSLLTGILVGLVPVLQAGRRSMLPALKGEALRRGKSGPSRWRSAFLMTQVAVSLVLLICAALFLRSLLEVHDTDPGFRIERAFALDLDLEVAGLSETEARRFYQQLLPQLEQLPDIEAASLANLTPLDRANPRRNVKVAGHEPPEGAPALRLSMNHISPGYFRTLDVSLLSGRDFDRGDTGSAMTSSRAMAEPLRVGIVNATMAQRFWPNEEPIGQIFEVGGFPEPMPFRRVEVVGVASDLKYRSLGEPPTPHFYLPLEQDFQFSMSLLVSTRGSARPQIGPVQQELAALHGNVRGFFARTLEDQVAFARLPAGLAASLFSLFGGVALLLATVGIYAAVTFAVVGRTRELGIRIALGALGRNVVGLVLKESLAVAALGLALGLVLALALSKLLASLLFGVSASDPAILAGVSLLVLAVAAIASYLPARRATRIDPIRILRQE